MMNSKISLGQYGEQVAQQEYQKAGYKIIAQNEFNRFGKQFGEIDFIAIQRSAIVFVEVKTRTVGVDRYGKGVESVNVYKQRKLLKAVKIYLLRNRQYNHLQPRIDVCLIEVKDLDINQYSVKIIANAVEDLY